MKKIALSACLVGCSCRYDGNHNLNKTLLDLLSSYDVVSFCPEEHCFGTPRPTIDLVQEDELVAISNENNKNISEPIIQYAEDFFDANPEIELYIGKDRSPSCAVESGKVYDTDKNLLHTNGMGLMSKVASDLGIVCWDAEVYVTTNIS
jgi:uncharacterized protein YbbK (DUF523 family)